MPDPSTAIVQEQVRGFLIHHFGLESKEVKMYDELIRVYREKYWSEQSYKRYIGKE